MAKMMTGGMAPKKQGKIGEAIDRMRIGRKAKLEAKSGAAADQGNAVKAKRLSNRAEKVGNRMELKALKKGGVLPATKTMGDYVGKGSLKGLGNMADAIGSGAKKLSNTTPEEEMKGSTLDVYFKEKQKRAEMKMKD
jgi:hypothetical protein